MKKVKMLLLIVAVIVLLVFDASAVAAHSMRETVERMDSPVMLSGENTSQVQDADLPPFERQTEQESSPGVIGGDFSAGYAAGYATGYVEGFKAALLDVMSFLQSKLGPGEGMDGPELQTRDNSFFSSLGETAVKTGPLA
ncbi:MAG: hypothetical protein M0Q13_11905 [Methanothrix sp.]|jgi:hypothetical protein|nr:hypothetical protein [Methanothrix sp.]